MNNAKVNNYWQVVKVEEILKGENYSSSNDRFSPLVDHTLSTDQGSILTLANRNSTNYPKQKIHFVSPVMNDTKCVEFWYYFYGEKVL